MNNPGKLILVPTPIGNLEDITLRALSVLKSADIILAEDTRVSSKLLKHFEIDKKLTAHHKFNEHKAVNSLIGKLLKGNTVAMISDAGTPGISDPGFLLVRACAENHIQVECLPGPTALIPALAVSGLPSDKFVFEGFLPQKKGRQTRLKLLAEESRTMVFYESPYRILKTLINLKEVLGDIQVTIARELTKVYEEVKTMKISEWKESLEKEKLKGELVVLFRG